MRNDMPAPALRLLASCTVRTVAARPRIRAQKEYRKRVVRLRKPFLIDARRFNGIMDAAKKLHRSPHTIRAWLETGRARYVD